MYLTASRFVVIGKQYLFLACISLCPTIGERLNVRYLKFLKGAFYSLNTYSCFFLPKNVRKKEIQPTIKNTPPIGVTAPSHVIRVPVITSDSAKANRLPLKKNIPARKNL